MEIFLNTEILVKIIQKKQRIFLNMERFLTPSRHPYGLHNHLKMSQ